MKRQILILVSVLALVFAGAAFAQSPQNTTAPGPTQQREPGQTNNNLPNPGNPQTDLQHDNQGTVQEHGTVEGTATENLNNQGQGTTTGTQSGTTTGSTSGTTTTTTGTMGTTGTTQTTPQSTTGTMPETETGTGVDVDVDTGSRAQGAVDVDVTRHTDTDTDASGSGVQTNGQYTDTAANNGSLPSTASDLPSVALMGLLALSAAFALRFYTKRNA